MYNYYKTDSQFYPTPAEVIDKMMIDEDVTGKKILEPSAGSGNIVRWCSSHGAREVVAYEIDEYLRRIVGGECRIIGSDFLQATASDVVGVDYIVMNPPFLHAAEHINHAFEIAPAGCIIVALCNHSNFEIEGWRTRGVSSLDKLKENCHKFGEHYSLGRVFEQAERRTACEIECVKLYKPGEGASEFDGFMFDTMPDDAGNGAAGIMRYDVVRDVVQRYICTVQRFEMTMQMCKTINELAKFPDDVLQPDEEEKEKRGYYCEDPLPVRFGCTGSDGKQFDTMDVYEYKKKLQRYYWRVIFQRLNVQKYETEGLRKQMAEFIERNANKPFTMHNIYKMLNTIVQTTGQRMQSAIVEAFDYICSLSAKNSTAGEKWKTNANYMVNKKFIVDYITDQGSYYRYKTVTLSCYSNTEKIDDITKALCFLTGRNFDEIGSLYEHIRKTTPDWGEWFQWGFFRCKGFLKGTMHFEFLDEKVWELFNKTAAKAKGWNLGQK